MASQRCRATSKRSGEQCRRQAVTGATVCAMHGGSAPQVVRAAQRRLALAEAGHELEMLGRPFEVDPAEAMLAMVHEAAGNVAFLRARVQELEQRAGNPVVRDEGGDLVAASPSIAGPTGSATKLFEAAPHVLVAMYDAERERLVRWAKMCRDAGVEEHRVQLAEREAEVLVGSFRVILEGLRLRLLEDGVEAALVARLWDTAVPGIVSRALEAASVEARS